MELKNDQYIYSHICIYLLLEGEDVSDASINGITKASLCLVADGDDGVKTLVSGDVEQQLGDVAGTENLVHRREVRRALLRVKVGREDAPCHALTPQKLAGPARASSSSSSSPTSSASSSCSCSCSRSSHACTDTASTTHIT